MVTHTTPLPWSPWRGRTRPTPAQPVPVDRASPADLMQLATDVGPAPMHVGAVLVLDTGPGFSVQEAQRLLGERIHAVPRLRQRLRRAPPGCGRPFWADDPAFDLRHHVRQRPCPPPGDERALLEVAAAVTGEPLPRSRPLWSATFVTGLAGGSTGLVIVMNHVLADGIGGLAVLARLVDEVPGLPPGHPQAAGFPVPAPRARTLAADAWAGRARRLTHPARSVRTIRQGLAELGGARPPRRLPPTSLNRPTGPQRRLDVVAADLAAVRDLGHAHGGTVNDVILAAIAGALRALLASRGEQLDLVTASVPVSARQAATGGQLGNQVGVMPVTLPTSGDLAARVTQIAAITRERKTAARGTSAAVLGTTVPAAGPHRTAPLVHQPPAADSHLRHQPARPGRAAHLRRCPGARADPHPEYHWQRHRHLRRAVLRRDTADHHPVRPQPDAGRDRADGRPAPGTGQRGPLTGAADRRVPIASVEAEHACAAHAHIVPIWTLPLAPHQAAALAQVRRLFARAPHEGWPHSVTAGVLPPGSRKVVRGAIDAGDGTCGQYGEPAEATGKKGRALPDGPGGSGRSGPH